MARYGFSGGLYINAGAFGTPTWVELSNTKEVAIEDTMGEYDATLRSSNGLSLSEPVLRAIAFTGKILADTADTTGYVALGTSYATRAEIDVMALDGKITVSAVEGYRIGMKNFSWNESQGTEDLLHREFSLKPCISANARSRVVITAGAPVYTTL